ncbi:hypothetical protein D3C86_1522710 [compost metagenome]
MHPTQATQGFQVHRGIAHGEVAAFYQRIAQLAGQVQVLEIAFIEAPGRQQDDQGHVVACRGLAGQGFLQGTKEPRHMLHLQVAVELR